MMPQSVNSNQALYVWVRDFLQTIYADKNINHKLITTLAMLITGMILGPHVQLFAIAMCLPLAIKLLSIVRRFERFVANEQVEVEKYFEPFVWAMIISLGNEGRIQILGDIAVPAPLRCSFHDCPSENTPKRGRRAMKHVFFLAFSNL